MAIYNKALSAFGTLFKLGNGNTPEEFVTVAEIRTLNGMNLTADSLETTVHNTPTPWRRFIPGLLDAGEVTMDINYVPQDPTHSFSSGMLSDYSNRIIRNVQVVFPDSENTTWTAPGFITSFQPSADPAGILSASVTYKIAGPPELE